ncbi:hypothetical protein [Spiroplasma floricola]|uniref:Uncharacterized protein n=1 Tax=Spiroplasma floricola 23-6 TaxID=1336749 RepID=A0A2K8SEU7_9MOLU|nr:hypothetical protein [Spiroplasma floricola]AUB31987.1 hypothetical protein SFLOR_v1c09390 [Spiroplasma floricola 23-6]
MKFFLRKRKKTQKVKNSEEKYEDRNPNHWTYNNDPMLNMDPIFTDDPNAKKISIEDITRQLNKKHLEAEDNSDSENVLIKEKLKNIKKNIGQADNQPKKTEGVLGSIIDNARKNTQSIQNHILETDPVIAKLQKIEELRKSGGVDADLYTDVEKIKNNTISYSQRAKEFLEQNSMKPVESELERVRRLSQRVQNEREELNKQNKVKSNSKVSKEKEVEPKRNIFLAVSKSQMQNNSIKDEVKQKLLKLKEIKFQNIEDEVEKTIQEIDSKIFYNESMKEEFFEEKLKEFDKLLKENTKPNRKPELIKPRRLQNKKK